VVTEQTDVLVVGGGTAGCIAAIQAARVQPSCMAMGQAAGAATVLAIHRGCASRDVSLPDLRALLQEHGAVVPDVS